jgi:hypothetical protein
MKKWFFEAMRTLEGYTRLSWEDDSGAAGILTAQLQGNFTSIGESLYAVEALRYLLAGILVCPFKVEKKEIRRPPKDGSEVAWLELAEIRERLEETDGW